LTAINSIAIFGGSFDPLHNGHLHLVSSLSSTQQFSKIVIVPAGDPWQKKPIATAHDRFEMTVRSMKAANVEVSDCEVKRDGPSYAIDTVREIARNNPGTSLTWIIGTDAFATVETWKDFDNLISLVEFLVIVRPGNKVDESKVNMKIKWSSMEIGALNISSTQVRAAIQQGQDFSLLVPASVAEYIKEKGLYGAA
jgi:nicotinate-nucleotide adenylyltransferase